VRVRLVVLRLGLMRLGRELVGLLLVVGPITVKGDFAEQAPVAPDAVPLPEIPKSVGPGSCAAA
jgi:hypothetical protein